MDLWQRILEELEQAGHILRAVPGKHEYCNWMRFNLARVPAGREAFAEMELKALNLVSDRIEE